MRPTTFYYLVASTALVLGLSTMQQARADFINGTELTITEQATPSMSGFRTFSFFVQPPADHTIGSINADFDATAIGQINAGNTLFADDFVNNGGGANPLQDSHFAFDKVGDVALDLNVFDDDSTTGLHAFSSLITAISPGAPTKIAHVVLQDGIVGTAVIDFAVRDSANMDTPIDEIFSVQFGGAAVPEPSSLAMLLALGGTAAVAHRRRRR